MPTEVHVICSGICGFAVAANMFVMPTPEIATCYDVPTHSSYIMLKRSDLDEAKKPLKHKFVKVRAEDVNGAIDAAEGYIRIDITGYELAVARQGDHTPRPNPIMPADAVHPKNNSAEHRKSPHWIVRPSMLLGGDSTKYVVRPDLIAKNEDPPAGLVAARMRVSGGVIQNGYVGEYLWNFVQPENTSGGPDIAARGVSQQQEWTFTTRRALKITFRKLVPGKAPGKPDENLSLLFKQGAPLYIMVGNSRTKTTTAPKTEQKAPTFDIDFDMHYDMIQAKTGGTVPCAQRVYPSPPPTPQPTGAVARTRVDNLHDHNPDDVIVHPTEVGGYNCVGTWLP